MTDTHLDNEKARLALLIVKAELATLTQQVNTASLSMHRALSRVQRSREVEAMRGDLRVLTQTFAAYKTATTCLLDRRLADTERHPS